jgi:hypothetical protein
MLSQATPTGDNRPSLLQFQFFAIRSNSEPELAIVHLEYAMRLSPIDPLIGTMWRTIAFAQLLAGRYDQSLSASERIAE